MSLPIKRLDTRGSWSTFPGSNNATDPQLLTGVQTVGRKTSWAKDVWANYFLGDRRLGDSSHFKKDASAKDG